MGFGLHHLYMRWSRNHLLVLREYPLIRSIYAVPDETGDALLIVRMTARALRAGLRDDAPCRYDDVLDPAVIVPRAPTLEDCDVLPYDFIRKLHALRSGGISRLVHYSSGSHGGHIEECAWLVGPDPGIIFGYRTYSARNYTRIDAALQPTSSDEDAWRVGLQWLGFEHPDRFDSVTRRDFDWSRYRVWRRD